MIFFILARSEFIDIKSLLYCLPLLKTNYVMIAFQFHYHPHDNPNDHYTYDHHHPHHHPYQSLAPRHKAQTGLRAAFLMLRSSRWGLLSAQCSDLPVCIPLIY